MACAQAPAVLPSRWRATVALAATIGVGIMIDSFRTSVTTWLQVMQEYLYLAPGLDLVDVAASVGTAIARIRVCDLSQGRSARVRSGSATSISSVCTYR